MSEPIVINGIYVIGNVLPVAGRNYCIARVTELTGQLPDEINMRYPDGTMRATDAHHDGDNMLALYAIVNISESEPDADGKTHEVYEVVNSMDDFLSPFGFPDDAKAEYIEYIFGARGGQINVGKQEFQLYDEDTKQVSTGFFLYDTREADYINALIEEAEPSNDVRKYLNVNDQSQIRVGSSITLLFGEAMDRAVDLYNGINYHSKAKEIAAIITNATYINQQGVKGSLNMVAAEKLLENSKEYIVLGGLRPDVQPKE